MNRSSRRVCEALSCETLAALGTAFRRERVEVARHRGFCLSDLRAMTRAIALLGGRWKAQLLFSGREVKAELGALGRQDDGGHGAGTELAGQRAAGMFGLMGNSRLFTSTTRYPA
jgi:hypothetical protein